MTKFRVVSLASSSEGNCFLFVTGGEKFFIDLGITPSNLTRKLRSLRINSVPSLVLLSHEHLDHKSGIHSLCKKFSVTICANASTFKRLNLDKSQHIKRKAFTTGEIFEIGKTKIKPFPIYHDAAEPVGFSIVYGKKKVVYLLDTGRIDERQMEEISDADLVIIDSNYDNLSLSQGKYPDSVKERIIRSGHLSNEIVGNIILNHPNQETEFWLGHLSKENNSPGIASLTINYILKYGKGQRKSFKVLPRKAIGPIWEPPEVRQYELILEGINISKELTSFRRGLDEENRKIFDRNLMRSGEIKPKEIIEIPARDKGNAWKIKGIDEGYVVARDISLPGVDGIEIGDKLWTCECGDFLWKSQKKSIPCKHILRIFQLYVSNVVI
jgi:phosphoribosyl 1,2-cyclic phosphodiesterase